MHQNCRKERTLLVVGSREQVGNPPCRQTPSRSALRKWTGFHCNFSDADDQPVTRVRGINNASLHPSVANSEWRVANGPIWPRWRTELNATVLPCSLFATHHSPYSGGVSAGQPRELVLDQLAIEPGPAQERVGGAVLDHLPAREHDDAVEIAQGRQAMRNGDHGAAAHQP